MQGVQKRWRIGERAGASPFFARASRARRRNGERERAGGPAIDGTQLEFEEAAALGEASI